MSGCLVPRSRPGHGAGGRGLAGCCDEVLPGWAGAGGCPPGGEALSAPEEAFSRFSRTVPSRAAKGRQAAPRRAVPAGRRRFPWSGGSHWPCGVRASSLAGRRGEGRDGAQDAAARRAQELAAGRWWAVEQRVAAKRRAWLAENRARLLSGGAGDAAAGLRGAVLLLHGARSAGSAGGVRVRRGDRLGVQEPLPHAGRLRRGGAWTRGPRAGRFTSGRPSFLSPGSIPSCGSCAATRSSDPTPRTAWSGSSGFRSSL